MTPKARLVAPLCVVIMDDGAELEVQATNFDMLSYERHARAHKWPPAQDAPLETATFVAWFALRREEMLPSDVTYDVFVKRAVSIETRRVVQDPTNPEPGDDS